MKEIERITQHVEEHQRELDRDRQERKRKLKDSKNYRAFSKLPYVTKVEMFCDNCQTDFVGMAYRTWSFYHNKGAWHTFCPQCGLFCIRHITDKTTDPYYEKSDKLRVMRSEAFTDMLRPDQYGFRTLYGDPFEHYYKRFQERSEDIHNRYAALGLTGQNISKREEEDLIKEEMFI